MTLRGYAARPLSTPVQQTSRMDVPHLAELVRRVAGLVTLVHCRLLRRCRHAVCGRLARRGRLHAATARACAPKDMDGQGVHAEEGEGWTVAGPVLLLCSRSILQEEQTTARNCYGIVPQ